MVSRLFGKLEAQRQRMLGRAGACATACVTAAALTAALPAMNLRRSMKGSWRNGDGSAAAPFSRCQPPLASKSTGYFAELPRLVIADRLLDFRLRVHHERTVGDDGFPDRWRVAEEQQRPGARDDLHRIALGE